MINKKKILIFILLVFIIFSGCFGGRNYDVLKLAIDSDPTTLDPALGVDVVSGRLDALIFNNLVKYNYENKIVSDLAKSWEIMDDNKTYIFWLKEGVKFSNGREVTADDVVYSFKRVLDPRILSPRTWVLDHIMGAKEFIRGKTKEIEGLKTLSKYKLEIKLKDVYAPFLSLLTMPQAAIVPKEVAEQYGKDFSENVIGTGPFILKEWVRDDHITFEANKNYFEGPPKIKKLEYRIIREPLTILSEFEMGNLDIIDVPSSEFLKYYNNPKYKKNIVSNVGLNIYYIGFNCQKKPFDNSDVRKAIASAIDKKNIINTIKKNKAVLAKSPIPPGLLGYDENINDIKYDYIEAKRLLEKEKISLNKEYVFLQSKNKEALEVAEIFQEEIKKIGIKIKIEQQEWTTFKANVDEGYFDAFFISWWADYPDGENFLSPLFHSKNIGSGGNSTRFKDKEIDDLIDKAEKEMEISKREALYKLIQRKVMEKQPIICLWHKIENIIHQPWVKGYKIYQVYNANKMTQVYIQR